MIEEKALDGKPIFFDSLGSPLPKYCTYCGSNKLSTGNLTNYNGIHCLNCGMYIHDCCSQNDIKQLRNLQGGMKDE